MKMKIIIAGCVLLLAIPILGFAQRNRQRGSVVSVCNQVNENERFECNKKLFNNKENTELRAEQSAAKEAAEVKNKADVEQDKGEGQFKFKF